MGTKCHYKKKRGVNTKLSKFQMMFGSAIHKLLYSKKKERKETRTIKILNQITLFVYMSVKLECLY